MPEIQLLSNGTYQVMVTAAGGGYSRWQGLALVRWREDATLDPWGTFCYLRDDTGEAIWSTTLQPSRQPPDDYAHDFTANRATFRRLDQGIEAHTEITVPLDADVELRRLIVTNHSEQKRTLSATSYAEIVLAPAATDSAHPAFSKLFIQTEIDPELQAILATRRPSTPDDPTPWLFHLAKIRAGDASPVSYETDRKRFIGRGRSDVDPLALDSAAPLSGSAGPVLDAVAAIRVPFVLDPGASVTIDWLTGIAATREACVTLARTVCEERVSASILEQAGAYHATTLQALQASDADALIYTRMAAAILYIDSALRADANVIAQNRRGQSDLWKFGISGDVAIVLLRLTDPDRLDLVRQLVQAHAYWKAHGVASELAILCAPSPGREPTLISQVRASAGSSGGAALLDKPGGIFVLDRAALDTGDRTLLQSVARVVVNDTAGTLAEQVMRRGATTVVANPDMPRRTTPAAVLDSATRDDAPLKSGFTPDAREYVITASTAQMTPAPWVNVIANPDFGTVVSESGSATTWSENAHEFRLTPWSNDPVGDANTEAFYIRDEASGHCWSPTLLPTPGAGTYVTRHGFGYSVFEHVEDEIESELSIHVAIDAPVKFSVLTLRNRSRHDRRLSVTGYLDWVLGDERTKTLMHVVTELDQATGALFARNAYNTDFAERTAFFAVEAGDPDHTVEACADRGDFLGVGGCLAAPAARSGKPLSGRVGAALDPCAALRVAFDLAPGQERVVIFRLGAGQTTSEAREQVNASRGDAAAQETLEAVHAYWRQTLGAVQVQTPDRALNALANGWLLYQAITSRLWGRTGFYQSSGAFGFRDQLQDVMALVHAAPALVREHLLRAAARQFVEGDAQHWWHPPTGKGVRTRCADDFLWLPLTICRYVETTGDASVLDESCPFLESRALHAGEASNYENPGQSAQAASLYEHGVRAIRHALSSYGRHGLPLMGSCDWNDGMNLVGANGQGESVWMAFFLITVLKRFAPLARGHSDAAFANLCEQEAQQLGERVNACGWDGAWYRRAWFDDGTVLGSAENSECRIDSIAQSWAVLSGAAPPERAQAAMDALDRQLVQRDTRLIQLLAPPFDTSTPSPGYIQGYVPGVRENGGQYTHAAVWAVMAFAALGNAERAWELLTFLNPLRHAENAAAVANYQVEPYVVAGDVYAFAPHAGRGGWTWYTGSAGWMYQLITESLLGLRRRGNELTVRPLLPKDWTSFDLQYRFGATSYEIACHAGQSAVSSTALDGAEVPDGTFTLIDDGESHSIVVTVGSDRDQQQTTGRDICNLE